MLSDEDIASVLTFVRNSFGNDAQPISAAGRTKFYTTEELLKEHPMR